jgi:hypothetical protein
VRFVHTTIAILFVLFIFLGNAGLRVFKHACEQDGIFTSYIIQVEDHCGEHELELPECCQKEEKKDCCSDEVDIYPVDFDFFQDYDLAFSLVFLPNESPSFVWEELVASSKDKEQFVLRPPPDAKTGREILIFNQVFRI